MTRNGPLTTKNGPVMHAQDKNKDRGGAKTKGRTSTRAGSLAGAYGALGHSLGLAGIGNIGGLFGGVTSDSEEGEGLGGIPGNTNSQNLEGMLDAEFAEGVVSPTSDLGVVNGLPSYSGPKNRSLDAAKTASNFAAAVAENKGVNRGFFGDAGDALADAFGFRDKVEQGEDGSFKNERGFYATEAPAIGALLGLVNPFLGSAYNIVSAVYNNKPEDAFLGGAGAIANFSGNPVVGLGAGLLSLAKDGYETFSGDSLNDLAGDGITPNSTNRRGDTGKKAAPKSKAPAVANVAQQQDDSPFSGIWNLGNSDSKRGTQKLGAANIGRPVFSLG